MQQILMKVMEPILTLIKGGWTAHGEGWAAHGHTPEEAMQKFREAEQRHQEIDARPLRYDWDEQEDIQKDPLTS